MKKSVIALFGALLFSACQSAENANKPAVIINNTQFEETQPRLASLPGVSACGAIVKSNIEVIYTGRWLEQNGSEAQPHTLIVMKPQGVTNQVYFASDAWKPWRINKPACGFFVASRDGNSIALINKLRGGAASANYQLNGETATGQFENKGKTWPITMTRYWADGVDELSGFEPVVEAPQF